MSPVVVTPSGRVAVGSTLGDSVAVGVSVGAVDVAVGVGVVSVGIWT
jgi:hypothetical protein